MDAMFASPALAAVAAHVALLLTCMFQMSMLRVTKSGGKAGDPTSYFSKALRAQELAVEWTVPMALLCLALHVQATAKWGGVLDGFTTAFIAGSVLFRVVFTAAYLALPDKRNFSIPRFIGAVGSYTCGFSLVLALLAYS